MAVIKRNPYKKDIVIDDTISYKSEFTQYDSISKIYNKARELGVCIQPFDIYAFLKKHKNIEIIYEDMDMDLSGSIKKENDIYIIKINKYQNVQRQRFTLAHEFGHILLHNSRLLNNETITDSILFRDKSLCPEERKVNELAADLLMPKNEFMRLIKDGYNTIEKFSEHFNVSPAAARYRAYKLGIIKEY